MVRRSSAAVFMACVLSSWAARAQSSRPAPSADAARPLRVAAAASLRGPLEEALNDWRQAGGNPALITYAGTPALVRQIEQGLPADVFLSADPAWMDHLEGRGGLRPGTRRDLLGNRLVLIARPGIESVMPAALGWATSRLVLGSGEAADRAARAALADWPGRHRLALAEVTSVPAGRYARAALEALELWRPWASRLAMTDNVRAALLLVARGETDLGIVYASDAQLEPKVRVIAQFAESLHPPIRYPVAVLASALHPRALEALDYLGQASAMKRFTDAGFTALARPLSAPGDRANPGGPS